jgi:predicted RNA-binding protein with PIN domain
MASLLLLIDGYNVVSPVAAPIRGDARWLQRERTQLLTRLTSHLSSELRNRTCVVFDAANPPPDRPSQFEVDGIEVCFAVDHPEADDLLEEMIRGHHAPKQLAVVSSDRRVQAAARRRGATPFESEDWLDQLLDGVVGLARSAQKTGRNRKASQSRRGGRRKRTGPISNDLHHSDQYPSDSSSEPSGVGQGGSASPTSDDAKPMVDPADVQDWLQEFGYDDDAKS